MFLINLSGKESIYEQIKSQIVRFISVGVLKPGEQLPSVRGLAEELGINPNTVMKAYQELEKNGYIYMLNKKGAFVSKKEEEQDIEKKNNIEMIFKEMKMKGVSKKEILEILNSVYEGGSNAENQ